MTTRLELIEKQTKYICNVNDDELVYLALFWVNGLSVNQGDEWKDDYYSFCKDLGIKDPKEFHMHWIQLSELGILEGDGGSEYITRAGKETVDNSISIPRINKIFNLIKNKKAV